MVMNSKLYDILKWVALVALDAVGLFYQTIASIWNLPFGDEVLKTCVALSVLIGTLIGVSGSKYNRIDFEEEGLKALQELMKSDNYIGEKFSEGGDGNE